MSSWASCACPFWSTSGPAARSDDCGADRRRAYSDRSTSAGRVRAATWAGNEAAATATRRQAATVVSIQRDASTAPLQPRDWMQTLATRGDRRAEPAWCTRPGSRLRPTPRSRGGCPCHTCAEMAGDGGQLLAQTGLPDAPLTGDDHQPAGTAECIVNPARQVAQLVEAADEP